MEQLKISSYTTIKRSDIDELELMVQDYIDDGWRPYGDLIVDMGGPFSQYLQVLVQ